MEIFKNMINRCLDENERKDNNHDAIIRSEDFNNYIKKYEESVGLKNFPNIGEILKAQIIKDSDISSSLDKEYGTDLSYFLDKMNESFEIMIEHAHDVPEYFEASSSSQVFILNLYKLSEENKKIPEVKQPNDIITSYFDRGRLYFSAQNKLNDKDYPSSLEEAIK